MKTLTISIKIPVRFCEVDSLGIVWHGNYLKYFEDGRKSFGDKYGLDLVEICKKGYIAPVVEIKCKYVSPVKYGDVLVVDTTYIDCEALKLVFKYVIKKDGSNTVVTTGETTQVLLDDKGELIYVMPPFLKAWKKKWNLL